MTAIVVCPTFMREQGMDDKKWCEILIKAAEFGKDQKRVDDSLYSLETMCSIYYSKKKDELEPCMFDKLEDDVWNIYELIMPLLRPTAFYDRKQYPFIKRFYEDRLS